LEIRIEIRIEISIEIIIENIIFSYIIIILQNTMDTYCKNYPIKEQPENCILGQGAFGKVIKFRCSGDFCNGDEFMAVKQLFNVSSIMVQKILLETEIYRELEVTKPYTLQLYGAELNSTPMIQYFQLIIGPEFTEYKTIFGDRYKHDIIKGLISGLEAIHSINIIHCDIKPPNILIDINKLPHIPKYIDFGVAVRATRKDVKGCPIIENGEGDARLGLSGDPRYLYNKESMYHFRTARSDIYALFLSLKEIYGERISTIINSLDIKDILYENKIWSAFNNICTDLLRPIFLARPSPNHSDRNAPPPRPSPEPPSSHPPRPDLDARLMGGTSEAEEPDVVESARDIYNDNDKEMENKVNEYLKRNEIISSFYTRDNKKRRLKLGSYMKITQEALNAQAKAISSTVNSIRKQLKSYGIIPLSGGKRKSRKLRKHRKSTKRRLTKRRRSTKRRRHTKRKR
jgi:serine/threonine protein kinase